MEVILVNTDDEAIGVMDKMQAHITGALHRAFSVFVFNNSGEVLLHQRALNKYHSSGLWTNTCCSHPAPDENTHVAANRRLMEEMGLKCDLTELFSFTYRADVGNDLIEHEYDHVFYGESDVEPTPDPDEVMNWKWIDRDTLHESLIQHSELYTVWFQIAWPKVCEQLLNYSGGDQ